VFTPLRHLPISWLLQHNEIDVETHQNGLRLPNILLPIVYLAILNPEFVCLKLNIFIGYDTIDWWDFYFIEHYFILPSQTGWRIGLLSHSFSLNFKWYLLSLTVLVMSWSNKSSCQLRHGDVDHARIFYKPSHCLKPKTIGMLPPLCVH